MKYVKKSVIVEAFQFGVDEMPNWFSNKASAFKYDLNEIQKLESVSFLANRSYWPMTAYVGDFIIKGLDGGIYPCKEDIFKETYDKVDE